jgi:hypothetical protein
MSKTTRGCNLTSKDRACAVKSGKKKGEENKLHISPMAGK